MSGLLLPAALAVLALLPIPATAQSSRKYAGPRPEKADVPYLLHATRLIEVEKSVATESKTKDGTLYTVPGAQSPVKTPVPEPIFLFKSEKINPESLSLFRMVPQGGNRTLLFPPQGKRRKDGPRPVFVLVTMLEPGLYRVEVNEPLEDGEYCLSPDGSNDVFCFSEY
ncbi:MAG: hypothetical protein WHT08_16050 [Bryobacteraceae bacterium]